MCLRYYFKFFRCWQLDNKCEFRDFKHLLHCVGLVNLKYLGDVFPNMKDYRVLDNKCEFRDFKHLLHCVGLVNLKYLGDVFPNMKDYRVDITTLRRPQSVVHL